MSGSPSCPGAGGERDALPAESPPRYITSALRGAGTENVNSSDFRDHPHPPRPQQKREDPRAAGRGRAEGGTRLGRSRAAPTAWRAEDPRGRRRATATHPERVVATASPDSVREPSSKKGPVKTAW